jgi:hypothetical protein
MDESAPFVNVGVDFFGPFRVIMGNEEQKMYGVIFCCLSVRAVHLEVCTDATGDRFLLALRRFVGRRGFPKTVLSDNAGQFKLSSALLKLKWREIESTEALRTYLTRNAIQWNFITERAPWRGASYERLIGLVKHHLKRVMGRRSVGVEELNTLFVEVERVVNLRPLSFVGEDLDGRPVRPIDFLQPMCDPFRLVEPDDEISSSVDDPDFVLGRQREIQSLTKLYQKTINLVERFWRAWREDYLLALLLLDSRFICLIKRFIPLV